ncbi:hypothetical protein GCM10010228_77960 [Streptomyces massasporeus]|nr:hypothetical protein GCM10010228_77960 [Streptomyces massasporeus]
MPPPRFEVLKRPPQPYNLAQRATQRELNGSSVAQSEDHIRDSQAQRNKPAPGAG